MSLIGITPPIYQKTAGSSGTHSQVFYENLYIKSTGETVNSFTAVDIPTFYSTVGSNNYYSDISPEITYSVANQGVPFISLTFSSGSYSLSATSTLNFNLYKLPYSVYSLYSPDQITNTFTTNNFTQIGSNGQPVSQSKTSFSNQVQGGLDYSARLPSSLMGNNLSNSDITYLQSFLSTPAYSLSAVCSAITNNTFQVVFPQIYKQPGSLQTELFEDKSQYFMEIIFNFQYTNPNSLFPFYQSAPGSIVLQSPQINQNYISASYTSAHTISNGKFASLLQVKGYYFVYFDIPPKPVFEYPYLTGTTSSFTQVFYWSNSESSDSYIFQSNTNLADTAYTSSSSAVTTVEIPKLDDYKQVQTNSFTLANNGSNTELSTTQILRKYQVNLPSNTTFIYRVCNLKKIVNLFGVAQEIMTCSDSLQATTQSHAISDSVLTKNSSPYTQGTVGFSTLPSLKSESVSSAFTISGSVFIVGGTWSGWNLSDTSAIVYLTYPNNNIISANTSSGGTFSFPNLGAGNYTLNSNYNSYKTTSYNNVSTGITISNQNIQNEQLYLSGVSVLSGYTYYQPGAIVYPDPGTNVKLYCTSLGFTANTISNAITSYYQFTNLTANTSYNVTCSDGNGYQSSNSLIITANTRFDPILR